MGTLREGRPSVAEAPWGVRDSGAGASESASRAMEACRQYLLLIADEELDADLRAKAGASDLVQETLLEAYADRDRFSGGGEGDLRAWLRRILLNNLSNFRRRYRGAAKRSVGRELSIHDGDAFGRGGTDLVSAEGTPSHHARGREQAEALAGAMGRLSEEDRWVILWRHQEHLPFNEIGRRQGRSADAARMAWARAVKRLQVALNAAARGGDEGAFG